MQFVHNSFVPASENNHEVLNCHCAVSMARPGLWARRISDPLPLKNGRSHTCLDASSKCFLLGLGAAARRSEDERDAHRRTMLLVALSRPQTRSFSGNVALGGWEKVLLYNSRVGRLNRFAGEGLLISVEFSCLHSLFAKYILTVSLIGIQRVRVRSAMINAIMIIHQIKQ